jgi:hypothetical protein
MVCAAKQRDLAARQLEAANGCEGAAANPVGGVSADSKGKPKGQQGDGGADPKAGHTAKDQGAGAAAGGGAAKFLAGADNEV